MSRSRTICIAPAATAVFSANRAYVRGTKNDIGGGPQASSSNQFVFQLNNLVFPDALPPRYNPVAQLPCISEHQHQQKSISHPSSPVFPSPGTSNLYVFVSINRKKTYPQPPLPPLHHRVRPTTSYQFDYIKAEPPPPPPLVSTHHISLSVQTEKVLPPPPSLPPPLHQVPPNSS